MMGESAAHCGRHLEYRCEYCEKYHSRDYHDDDFLTEINTAVMSGSVVFVGTRIPVEQVIGMFRKHISREEIQEDYPALTQKQLEYAYSNALRDKPYWACDDGYTGH